MSVSPIAWRRGSRAGWLVALLCAITLGLDYWIIQTYPTIYWYDPYMRLAHRDELFVGRWLPALQGLIVFISQLTTDLLAIRMALAGVAAGTVWAMYLWATRLFNATTGLIAATFLASNLMFVGLSTVPYPEVLFIGLAFLTLYFLDEPRTTGRYYAGVVCLNLACLTRYEGWLLAAVLIGTALVHDLRAKAWRAAVTTTALFSFVPLVWASLGRFVIEPQEAQILTRLTVDYWLAFTAQYLDLLQWQAGWGVIVLGLAGWLWSGWRLPKRKMHWLIAAFLVLDWLLIGGLHSWSFGNLRQPFMLMVFLVLYAAFALERLVFAYLRGTRFWRVGLVGVVALMGWLSVWNAVTFVANAANEPDFRASAWAGRWLKTQALDDAQVVLLSDHLAQPYMLATYSGLGLQNVINLTQTDWPTARQQLKTARVVYVVAVYTDIAKLSPAALSLLNDLEANRINAQWVAADSARIWILNSNAVP